MNDPDPARTAVKWASFVTFAVLVFVEACIYFGSSILFDNPFLPTPGELMDVNILWYIVFVFCFWWVVQYLHEMFSAEIETELLDCRRRKQRRQPRPALFQSVNDMANAHTLRRLNEGLTPLDAAHYAAIYHRLARKPEGKRWTITRSDLDVKWGGQPAFHNLTKIYRYPSKLGQHWHDLGWIDGYVQGDPNSEVWTLNEVGRAAFVENAGNHLRSTSPTE